MAIYAGRTLHRRRADNRDFRPNARTKPRREINGLSADERLIVRRSRIVPLVTGLEDWMRAERAKLTEVKEWLDEYDPKVIDELPIKHALSRIANRRNAAKTRLANKKQTPSTS